MASGDCAHSPSGTSCLMPIYDPGCSVAIIGEMCCRQSLIWPVTICAAAKAMLAKAQELDMAQNVYQDSAWGAMLCAPSQPACQMMISLSQRSVFRARVGRLGRPAPVAAPAVALWQPSGPGLEAQ